MIKEGKGSERKKETKGKEKESERKWNNIQAKEVTVENKLNKANELTQEGKGNE